MKKIFPVYIIVNGQGVRCAISTVLTLKCACGKRFTSFFSCKWDWKSLKKIFKLIFAKNLGLVNI